ncbi:MAG TPA: hypothetical protein VHV30_02615 [Polyangiaceae bacterium]|jgi:hypothetical protein|nr:hypothetical protein [Polyangiaceae bacterium]
MAAEVLPDSVARLLWDVDVSALDLARDRALILERVMSRGTWEAMKWLRRRYAKAVLADFVRQEGARVLSPRDLAYWALVCDVEIGATSSPDVGGGRPRWAGS